MTLAAMSLIFEGAVSILLIAVIVYAIKLNRRILALKAQEPELKEMIAQFNDAATQAQISAGHLKSAGTNSERNLRATIERAQAMRDDLLYAIERGGNISDRVVRSRQRSPAPPVKPLNATFEQVAEELNDRDVERNAERAVEDLVDRFADQAESSLWRAAKNESADSDPGIDREHWFDDNPARTEPPAQPAALTTDSRVTAWTPGAGSRTVVPAVVDASPEDGGNSSRSDDERLLLKALRTSGVRS